MFKTFIVALLMAINVCGYSDYAVRVIYFRPTDAPAAPVAQIRRVMERTQKFYANEMEKHKFGRKTFRLEKDNSGEIVVHKVKARHKAAHYFNDTKGTLDAELPAEMKNKNDILISFIGGLNGVEGGWNGQGQAWFGHDCGACKGWVAVANKNGNFLLSTVAHELGHAFGLYHNLQGKQGANFLMWFDGVLDTHEARWLDKSRYFNNKAHIANLPPKILNLKRPEAMLKNNADYVRFSVDIQDNQGLYQAQIFRSSDWCVLDWTQLDRHNGTVKFEVRRTDLIGEWQVWIHAQDTTGNQSIRDIAFVLSEKKEKFKVVTKHKDPDKLNKEKEEDPEEKEGVPLEEEEKVSVEKEDLKVLARNKMFVLWGFLKKAN